MINSPCFNSISLTFMWFELGNVETSIGLEFFLWKCAFNWPFSQLFLLPIYVLVISKISNFYLGKLRPIITCAIACSSKCSANSKQSTRPWSLKPTIDYFLSSSRGSRSNSNYLLWNNENARGQNVGIARKKHDIFSLRTHTVIPSTTNITVVFSKFGQ